MGNNHDCKDSLTEESHVLLQASLDTAMLKIPRNKEKWQYLSGCMSQGAGCAGTGASAVYTHIQVRGERCEDSEYF